MSARRAAGNVSDSRACAATPRAAAVNPGKPRRQPCAARARAQAPAPQWGVTPAPREVRPGAQVPAPRRRFPHADKTPSADHRRQPSERTADLFQNHGGLTMARAAPSFFYDPLKFVPLGGFDQLGIEKSESVGKSLKLRSYTLCEVSETERQSVPPRKPASSRRQNRPGSRRSAGEPSTHAFGFTRRHPDPCNRLPELVR